LNHEIRIEQRFRAPIERVFDAVTDHAGMGRWIEGTTVTVDEPGDPSPNGLGALRRIRWRAISIWERVVLWEPPTTMHYRVERGSPVRDHLGRFTLTALSPAETLVDYRIEYRVPWYFGGRAFGTVLTHVLGRDLRRGLAKLAELLERG
jgi:hypothetical protein